MEPEFDKWSGVLWKIISGTPIAYCPKHFRRLELVVDEDQTVNQQQASFHDYHTCLSCPVDNQKFELNGERLRLMQERYEATLESITHKGATYRDLDNVYTPVLRVEPKPKDDRYSIQVQIDETPNGKKLVIYAMDRKDSAKKVQIFIDPEKDKITFDSSDFHPNMIFSKVEAHFKDRKKASLEQDD